MPRLARLRYVSIGHPNARLDDFTLDLRDAFGRATDSTLWLRNGGGKSSILNLFFALVRPDRREFLGKTAEAGKRTLDDYIQRDDRSVVICEWELDHGSGQLDFGEQGERYLTGVFYEWRTGPAEEERLRRLFFASRPSNTDARLTLEGLPLFVPGPDGRRRRNLSGFRAEWVALRDLYPQLEVSATEHQREWGDILENAGIDPELFGYQIRMNQREGAVDELFRFDEHEKFIDFLLELALDPAMGQGVGRNVATYRRELSQRKNELIPERDLALGLASRLAPLALIAEQRAAAAGRTGVAAQSLERLRSHLEDRVAALSAEEGDQRALHDRERQAALEARAEAAREQRRAAALRRLVAERRYTTAAEELERDSRVQRDAWRDLQLWEAAVPLHNALRYESQARTYQEQLTRLQEQFAPLLSELQAAAGAFAGGLRRRLTALRREESDCARAEREARDAVRESLARMAEAGVRVAVAKAEIRRIGDVIEQAVREREELVRRGAILPEESGAAAVGRLNREIGELDHRAASLAEQAVGAVERQARLRLEMETAAVETRGCAERAAAERRRLDEATAARHAIEQKPLLRALLEIESVDLERLPDRALLQLREASHTALESIVTLKMERAEDERAAAHLEDTGLLPPSRDAQTVLAALRAKLPAAWSGWAYIEANTPDIERVRYDLAQRLPLLATGVIVRDADFDKACEMLEADDRATPEAPILIAPASAFANESAPEGKVIGPASSAYYDRSEGRSELLRRRIRLDAADDKIHQGEDRRREIEALDNQIRDFRGRYPRGWFAEQAEKVDRELEAEAGWRHRSGQLAAEIGGIEQEVAALENDRKAADSARGRKRSDRGLVEQFVRLHESTLDERRSEIESKRRDLEMAEREGPLRQAEAARSEELAAESAAKGLGLAIQASQVEQEVAAIEYAQVITPSVSEGIEALKDRYIQLKAEYENKIEAKHILQFRQEAMDRAGEERRKFQTLLQPGLDEAMVREALDKLADSSLVDVRRREAQSAHASALGKHGNQKQVEQRAKADLDEANRVCGALGAAPDLPSMSPAQAEEQAPLAEAAQLRLEAEASQHEERVRAAERLAQECGFRAAGMRKDLARLEDIRDSFKELLEAAAGVTKGEAWTAPADDECADHIGAIQSELRQARTVNDRLDSERRQCAQEIRSWAQRADSPKSAVAARFGAVAEPDLEMHAGNWIRELELRAQTIDAQLGEINQHRDLLIDETLAAAEQALTLLRSAQTHSRLPDHVPGLGGAQFLRITHHAPEETGERRGRIGALIDDLVDAGEIPPGLGLVQQAVRRLAKPIRVKVLHPDPDLGRQAVDIVDLARFSGGEQLTAAILLYCTLAQLRARSRGGRRPSSVLILDNPIGKASRVRFLELQRDVARAMGVQLFYTTGVNDLEALRTLPNVIRVRNSRSDRNTGRHVLEHEAMEFEAARIVREEP